MILSCCFRAIQYNRRERNTLHRIVGWYNFPFSVFVLYCCTAYGSIYIQQAFPRLSFELQWVPMQVPWYKLASRCLYSCSRRKTYNDIPRYNGIPTSRYSSGIRFRSVCNVSRSTWNAANGVRIKPGNNLTSSGIFACVHAYRIIYCFTDRLGALPCRNTTISCTVRPQ